MEFSLFHFQLPFELGYLALKFHDLCLVHLSFCRLLLQTKLGSAFLLSQLDVPADVVSQVELCDLCLSSVVQLSELLEDLLGLDIFWETFHPYCVVLWGDYLQVYLGLLPLGHPEKQHPQDKKQYKADRDTELFLGVHQDNVAVSR